MAFDIPHNPVKETENIDTASSWILVLSAADIPHTIESKDGSFYLFVPERYVHKADYELATYINENQGWPPPKQTPDSFAPFFKPFSFILMGIMGLFFL